MNITIDPEFKALIPPLAPEELAQLEANIIKDGCRDPLVVWRDWSHNEKQKGACQNLDCSQFALMTEDVGIDEKGSILCGYCGSLDMALPHHNLILIDGHNRHAICTKHGIEFDTVEMEFADRESVMDWMDANQLGRRNLSPDAFRLALGRRYNRTKKTKAEAGAIGGSSKSQNATCLDTAKALADQHSVHRATVIRAGKFADEVAAKPELQKAIADRKPIKQVIKETKREQAKQLLQDAVEIISEAEQSDAYQVFHCSMAELLSKQSGIDCIISDPPYPREFVGLYGDLARHCADAGISRVAVMCGQSYLPEIIASMCEHLEYRWTIAYMTPGGQAVQQWQTKVNTFWKPILVFGKSDEWMGDVSTSKTNDNDKRFHGWGQSESGMLDLVNRLSKPGETVCDPFVGAGTTGVVSLALGRKFIGCDIDESHCITARARMSKTLNEMKS
jgi:site-specific DNA-methyltransferase (adenine-specific)